MFRDPITTSSASYIYGRVNIDTASAVVLGCLPGMDPGTARQLVDYRRQNPNNLASIAWIVDALGASSPVVQALAQGDYPGLEDPDRKFLVTLIAS